MKYNKELLNRFLTEKVAIALRTQEEWDMFMELLEEETDLTWVGGDKPTRLDLFEPSYGERNGVSYFCEFLEGLKRGNILSYESKSYEIIEFKELVKEKEMNLADKLRFLADRLEDGKSIELNYKGQGWKLYRRFIEDLVSKIDSFHLYDFRLAPQWTFTEDEKVILRNLTEEYNWVARNARGDLFVYRLEPQKGKALWIGRGFYNSLKTFEHLFQSIQWSDDEPCEFRRYL